MKTKTELLADIDRVTAERDAALEEVEALKHWRDLALQFDNHRMKALWHLKTLVSDGAHYDAAAAFLAEPPVPASELQQRLTAADERADVLEGALRELLAGTGNSPGANRKYGKARAVLAGSQKQAAPEPYQGIPGTSFQRLNALANQGE